MNLNSEKVEVPRNFKLLDEMEADNKGISIGLAEHDDITLSKFNACIMAPGTQQFTDKLYTIQFECSQDYPKVKPTVKFLTLINLPFVDSKGRRCM